MNSSEKNIRSDFDEQWREAFEGAEIAPDESVWAAIDSDLNKAEAVRFKRYYIFYRSAAAVLLLISIAGFAYFQFGRGENEELVVGNQILVPNAELLEDQLEGGNNDSNASQATLVPENGQIEESFTASQGGNGGETREELFAQTENRSETTVQRKQLGLEKKGALATSNQLNAFSSFSGDGNAERGIEETNIAADIANLQNYSEEEQVPNVVVAKTFGKASPSFATLKDDIVLDEKEIVIGEVTEPEYGHLHIDESKMWYNQPEYNTQEVKNSGQTFYANLSLNSDFFDPKFTQAAPTYNADFVSRNTDVSTVASFNTSQRAESRSQVSDRVSPNEMGLENTPQASFTYGINVGMKVSKRFVFESGVNYSNFNTSTATMATVSDGELNNNLPLTVQNERPDLMVEEVANTKLFHTGTEHQINNSFEFASIPLTAGYILGVNKFNLILKAGMSTDFFLRNEITGANQQLSRVEMRAGSNSPFNRVMLSGMIGNEINYELNKNYSISVSANYRQFLNTFTKSSADFRSRPNSYGMGMVFRYHFD